MKRIFLTVSMMLCMAVIALSYGFSEESSHKAEKPSPEMAINLLKKGNLRFVSETTEHPHTSLERIAQAGKEDQGDHAYATVITCSDSRVPVERIFDAGIMDIFVIRVAGNVCDVDESGSIEYGLVHVRTPVLVVLGHTQCGAVTAVTHTLEGNLHGLETNIPALIENIEPAVHRTKEKHPEVHGDELIALAVEENVWVGIEELFMRSPSTRQLVKSGKVKVIGAIYNVGTGKVDWQPESKVTEILNKVEKSPDKTLFSVN